MFQNLNNQFLKITKIEANDIKFFNDLIEIKNIKKKTTIVKEGEIATFSAYVNKGCVRTYFLNENGHEFTLSFAMEDWWIGDLASLNSGKPTKLYMETLEDTELFIIKKSHQEKLFKNAPVFERVFRIMIERHAVALTERLFETIAKPALERYQNLLKKYPAVSQRVSQIYIASYLGISPEFLSMMRSKLAKAKKVK